jgi:hypothetical protein
MDPDALAANAEADAKAWQQERNERLIAEHDAALPELEKEWQQERNERLIAKYDAAFRELAPEPGAARIRVQQPRARRRGAGRPAGRRAASPTDDSDPEPEQPLARCRFCGRAERYDPRRVTVWTEVHWSAQLGAWCCVRCYERRTAKR